MMKKLLMLIFLLFPLGVAQSSPIAKSWLFATILIENEWGKSGTGFLIFRNIDEDKGKIFLCTNKHVIHEDKDMRDKAKFLKLHLNIKEDGKATGKTVKFALFDSKGQKMWRGHPMDDVDVLVIDVTPLINQLPNMLKKWADYSLIADKELLSEKEITIGEDVLVIGYPFGLIQGNSNLPIVRQGIIASQIGEIYIQKELNTEGKPVAKKYRGFLIDGGIMPGSSGSPVVLKPVVGRVINDKIQQSVLPPYLLGIISKTRTFTIKSGESLPVQDLGVAYDAITIKETIELFFQ